MQPRAAQFRFARQLSTGVRALGSKMSLKAVGFVAVAVGLKLVFGTGVLLSAGAAFTLYLVTGGWRFAVIVVKTLPRDVR